MKQYIWLFLLGVSMLTSMIPIIDVFGGSNTISPLWAKRVPFAYLLDFCVFCSGIISFYFCMDKIEKIYNQ